MSRRILTMAAFALGTIVTTSRAQLQVTPIVGVYSPTKALVADSASSAFFETESGALYGLRIGYWFSPRIAVEGGLAMSPTRTRLFSPSSTTDFKFKSTAKMVDLRGIFLLTRPGQATGLHVSAGVAYTRASNALFDLANEINSFEFKTSIGGVVGLGVTHRIASGTSLRVDAEDRIYKVHFDQPGTNIKDRTQQDYLFTVGLAFTL